MTTTTNTIPTPRRPAIERPADRVTDNRAWFHEQFILSGGRIGERRQLVPVKLSPKHS